MEKALTLFLVVTLRVTRNIFCVAVFGFLSEDHSPGLGEFPTIDK